MYRKLFCLLLLVAIAINGALQAQVSLSARVFYPNGEPVYDKEHEFIYEEDYCRYYLKVDGEDTLRSCCPADTIRFENIPVGACCRLYYKEFLYYYKSEPFTLTSDEFANITVTKIPDRRPSFFYSKAQKDSVFCENVAKWSVNADGYDTVWYTNMRGREKYWLIGDCYSLELARQYYDDWFDPITSWRTFIHSADSAYKYCVYASRKYSFLYYPARQLAQHLGYKLKVKSPKRPNSKNFLPQPVMSDYWWQDTTVDVFSMWEKYQNDNDAISFLVGKSGEKSLCYPTAPEGTMRCIGSSPLGATFIWRVQDGKMYRKKVGIVKPKIIESVCFALTDAELDTLTLLMNEFDSANIRNDEDGPYVIDGASYRFEYIVDGQYRLYTTCEGSEHPLFSKIIDKFWQVYKAHHVKPKNRKTDY